MLPTQRQVASPRRTSLPSFLSDAKNSWKTIASLVASQCLATLYTHYFGQYEATNTVLLYDRSIAVFTVMFLTFQAEGISGFLLAVYNAVLLTGLLGWPQTWISRPVKKENLIHILGIVSVIWMRMLLGYLFGRGTGFAYPVLFFNDAIHETTRGLSVIILYCITRTAYNNLPPASSRLFLPYALLLWSPNALRGPIFFWSFSVASITGIQALISLLTQRRQTTLPGRLKSPPSRLARFLAMLRVFLTLSTAFASISYVHALAYSYAHRAHVRQASTLPDAVLTEFLVLSYPRRNDSTLLASTLQSYAPRLGARFAATVYTTAAAATHAAFRDAQRTYRGRSGLEFFSDPDPAQLHLERIAVPGYLPGKQTLDLYSALAWAERRVRNETRYVGIMEDDFEWCKEGWDELRAVLYEVAQREAVTGDVFCGVFVATGGSGLLVRPSTLPLLQSALQTYAFDLNPDIILQDCLRGELPLCAQCRLAASRRLLFRHTGARESTYSGRFYPEDRWQCGWRQPFNGELGVWVP